MKYLVKGAISDARKYVAIPTNRESRDIRHCRTFEVELGTTMDSLVEGIRRVFQLSPIDEVVVEYEGLWHDNAVDGRIAHPFLETTFPAELNR